jgi:hypothetical protein
MDKESTADRIVSTVRSDGGDAMGVMESVSFIWFV